MFYKIRHLQAYKHQKLVQIYILRFINRKKNISQEINLLNNNISREMIKEEKNVSPKAKTSKNDEKIISQEIKTDKNNKKDTLNKIIVNEKVKKIRINNAMATADIKLKKELSKKWKSLSEYFLDDKFGKITQLLSDCFPMVVGDKYIILTAESEGLIDNLYENFRLIEDFFTKFYKESNVVFLLNGEFESVKQQYISDRNNNIIYHVQEEYGKLINESNDLANQAINLFGKDIVDIE